MYSGRGRVGGFTAALQRFGIGRLTVKMELPADSGLYRFGNVTIHQGKELSFTNLLDLEAAARIVLEFTEPAASVIKHTNPCGVATGADAADAYVRSRDADPLSAFGGIIGLNRTLDVATAEAIVSTFIEAVVAPDLDDAARAILARKANLRVVTADFAALAAAASLEWRSILGATLVQQLLLFARRQPLLPTPLDINAQLEADEGPDNGDRDHGDQQQDHTAGAHRLAS